MGTGETLTPSGSVGDGNGGANYAVSFANNTAGAITTLAIVVTAASGTKVYDGTTTTTATPSITSGSLATGDTAAFSEAFTTRNEGPGRTLTAAGSVSDGNSGNNYAVTWVSNTTGQITPRLITVTAAAGTKVYDGTTSSAVARRSPAAAWPAATRRPSARPTTTRTWAPARRSRRAGRWPTAMAGPTTR